MNSPTTSPDTERLEQLATDLELQSADFLWIEFYASDAFAEVVQTGSKLDHLLARARRELPKSGFDWIMPPDYIRQAINLTRKEVLRAGTGPERLAVVKSFLADRDPPFLRRLELN